MELCCCPPLLRAFFRASLSASVLCLTTSTLKSITLAGVVASITGFALIRVTQAVGRSLDSSAALEAQNRAEGNAGPANADCVAAAGSVQNIEEQPMHSMCCSEIWTD